MTVLEDDGIAFDPFTSAPEPDLDAGWRNGESVGWVSTS